MRRCHPVGPVDCLGIIFSFIQLQTSDPLGNPAKTVLGYFAWRDNNLARGYRNRLIQVPVP